ncbi:hypothetical protein Q5P01_012650 [Channa striata]|uniref:UPAR/Ly6 domain-containing protein n=1 Tax=Channa striata TaxID=64152 RepID=A0AA88MQ58_CHASR|nr:hypothetical protein Q5P01_012650 [Channa striata]
MLHFLLVAVLCFNLPPLLLCQNLLCVFSPILLKEQTIPFVSTECTTDEVCFIADGRYGNHSTLSAKGCMAQKDCSQVRQVEFRGTAFSMSYACCDWPYCNACPGITDTSLSTALTLMTAAWTAGSL